MRKTAEFIEESRNVKSLSSAKASGKRSGRGRNPNSLKNLAPFTFPKGVSGNPGGKPKFDVAAHIAQAILEKNQEAAYQALAKALLKGNAYVFKELADRAYGKIPNKHEVSGAINLTMEQVDAELAEFLNGIAAAKTA